MTSAGFAAGGGADGFLRHLGSEASQAMDARIVDDLRNFLFDPPVAMDLAAINIQRGRDLGLGTLNETRKALGLEDYTRFGQITDDRDGGGDEDGLRQRRQGRSLDRRPRRTARQGRDGRRDLHGHHRRPVRGLRDGDRYYFEHALNPADVRMVKNTSLSDIITRNTDATDMQADVFMNVPRGPENDLTI